MAKEVWFQQGKDRITGEPNRWRHGPFADENEALEHFFKMRETHPNAIVSIIDVNDRSVISNKDEPSEVD